MNPTLRPLNARERLLGMVFAFILTGTGAWLLWDAMAGHHAAVLKRQEQVRKEIADARRWLDEKPLWETRRQWLDAEMKGVASPNEASSRFLEQVQKSASQRQLKIDQQGLLDPLDARTMLAVGAKVALKGSLKDVAAWLVDMQQPGHFVEVSQLELRPAAEAGQVECAAQFRKWYVVQPAGVALHRPIPEDVP